LLHCRVSIFEIPNDHQSILGGGVSVQHCSPWRDIIGEGKCTERARLETTSEEARSLRHPRKLSGCGKQYPHRSQRTNVIHGWPQCAVLTKAVSNTEPTSAFASRYKGYAFIVGKDKVARTEGGELKMRVLQ
jgi:hypothetical protein